MIITTDTVISSSSLGPLITNDQLLRSMPNITLALFLLHERGQSKWKPYIDILPDQFDTPLYFDSEQLNRLKSSAALCKNNSLLFSIDEPNDLLGDILTHIQRIARQYCYLHNLLKVRRFSRFISMLISRRNSSPGSSIAVETRREFFI